jgi:hypothetical protein
MSAGNDPPVQPIVWSLYRLSYLGSRSENKRKQRNAEINQDGTQNKRKCKGIQQENKQK